MWGWNNEGQLGFPARNLKNHQEISSFSHNCQCDANKSGSSSTKSTESHKNLINTSRSFDFINIQASPKLLDFWNDDVKILQVACGDRHTIFLLGMLLTNLFSLKITYKLTT